VACTRRARPDQVARQGKGVARSILNAFPDGG
jgi:hypothetical protein